jgi:hypothetical protein
MESPKKPSRRDVLSAPAREDLASATLNTDDRSEKKMCPTKRRVDVPRILDLRVSRA